MAKKEEMEKQSTPENYTIIAKGPADSKNGATVLRYKRLDGRKTDIDIVAGQTLKVGDEITPEEAENLLNLKIWNFERVND
ncbi:hypothetical protein [Lysinibacillus fusiformis]|uniref:hypothetical protein n=1 Tax=Lysinibacillus fusiformis TaxID=28031 RepID=UPI003D09130B